MEDILDIYKQPYDSQCPQVCIDEMSTQLIGEVRAPLPAERGKPGRYDTAYTAISGDLLSAVISIRYILGFRKDNPNVFNMLVQNLSHCQRHKMRMLLILLTLCLRKSYGVSHLFSTAYAFAGNRCSI